MPIAGCCIALAGELISGCAASPNTVPATQHTSAAAPAITPPKVPKVPKAPLAPPIGAEGEAALRQGLTALQQHRLQEAVGAFEHAVQSDPRSPLTHDYLGVAQLQRRRFAEALRQFHEEIRLQPDSGLGWARIADVYHAQDDPKGAIRALERAVALDPSQAQFYFNLGMLYPQVLELNKAVASLNRYSELEPTNHYAHYLRGMLLYKLARLDDAEQALNEAIRLAPNAGLYHFALAQVYFRRTTSPETTARTRAELQSALDDGAPEPADVYYYLGLCSQRTGDWETARQELTSSVQMAPEAWGAYYALAQVLQKLGRAEEAQKARARFADLRAKEDRRLQRSFYEQEVQRNPNSAAAHFQLAGFLIQQGDRQRARQVLAQASRLASDNGTVALKNRIAALVAELRMDAGR